MNELDQDEKTKTENFAREEAEQNLAKCRGCKSYFKKEFEAQYSCDDCAEIELEMSRQNSEHITHGSIWQSYE